jgi:hypothetical protein
MIFVNRLNRTITTLGHWTAVQYGERKPLVYPQFFDS